MSPTTQRPAEPPPEDERAQARQTDSTMWTIVGHMTSALAVYGGLGYLIGRWTGHPILLLFGALFGMGLSLWYTIRVLSKPSRK